MHVGCLQGQLNKLAVNDLWVWQCSRCKCRTWKLLVVTYQGGENRGQWVSFVWWKTAAAWKVLCCSKLPGSLLSYSCCAWFERQTQPWSSINKFKSRERQWWKLLLFLFMSNCRCLHKSLTFEIKGLNWSCAAFDCLGLIVPLKMIRSNHRKYSYWSPLLIPTAEWINSMYFYCCHGEWVKVEVSLYHVWAAVSIKHSQRALEQHACMTSQH